MSNLKVRIKGSPLKTVTAFRADEVVVGDIYVHALNSTLFTVDAIDPIKGSTDLAITFSNPLLDGPSRVRVAADAPMAVRRSITAEEAGNYFGSWTTLDELYRDLI